MKVLISGAFWHGSLEESYARAFEEIGWKVARFDWERHQREHPLAFTAMTNKVLRFRIADRVGKWFNAAIQDSKPDLVLVIKGRMISPDTLIDAKRSLSDRPLVNFNPDSPWDTANRSSRLLQAIPLYDTHFTWNKHLIPKFQGDGGKSVFYLPFGYDPVLHHPLEEEASGFQCDAVFVGTCTPSRDELLGSLGSTNIKVVGNGWGKAKWIAKDRIISQALYGEDAVRVLSLGACSINILREQNIGSHNMRTFEIPASRTAMLTTRSEEQCFFFAEGSEMECFDSPEELLEKVRMFSADPAHARTIARNGYERVREETYTKRARTMLACLGFA